MIIRATTATGDMTFGNGLQNYFTNEAAIEANIRSKLLEWVGDCWFNIPAGIDYLNLLSTGQQANLVIAIKTLVLQCYGVVSIVTFNAVFVDAIRIGTISMTLQTIYSPSAQIVVTPPQVGTT